MKRQIIPLIIIVIIIISLPVYGRYVEGVNHVHDTNSDGVISEEKLIELVIELQHDFVFLTPHLSCVAGICKDSTHFHAKYDFSKTYYESQGAGDNILRCAEVFTKLDKAHVLLLGRFDKAVNDPDFKSLGGILPPSDIIEFAKKYNLITVLAHPHDAYDIKVLNKFDAIEFFNTKGYKIWNNGILQLNGDNWDAGKIDLDVYCQSILNFVNDSQSYKLIAVTGGCDAHFFESVMNKNFQKEELSFGHTLVRLDDKSFATCEIVLEAIKLGRTYAVNYSNKEKSIKIENLNHHPQFAPYKVTTVLLKGLISYTGNLLDKKNIYLEIYRDGQKFKVIKIGAEKFSFNFTDNPAKGKHVYFLYIKDGLVTSPIVFDVTEKGNDDNPPMPVSSGAKVINNSMPCVSPNGQLIAFISDRDGQNEVYIMDTNGSMQRRLTYNSKLLGSLTWWPDSQGVLFTSLMRGKRDIWMVGINNRNLTCLTRGFIENCSSPNFIPHVNEIIFWVNKDKIMKICFTKNKPRFVEPGLKERFGFPDNSQLASANAKKEQIKYFTNSNYQYGFYGLNIGRDILFYCNKNGDNDIYLRRPDGAEIPLIVLPGEQRYASATKIGIDTVIFFDSTHLANQQEQTGQDIYSTTTASQARIIRLTHGSK